MPDPHTDATEKLPLDYQPAPSLLAERIILVTGAGRGLGRELAIQAALLGATVVLVDKEIPPLEAVYDEIERRGGAQPAIYPINLEGAKPEDYEQLAITLDREFGRLDGLVHNAAMLGALSPLAHHDIQLWFQVMQVNLNAPFLLTRACLGLLNAAEDASLLFIGDDCQRAYWGAYGVSKAGAAALATILADELETNTAIRVNVVETGPFRSALRALAYPGEDPNQLPAASDLVPALIRLLGPDGKLLRGRRLRLAA
ncbi:MAG TPA: SDR family NAD(P)-dependent oxidoreductase [Thiotrichales bacterium]|nr:SDR family NAD(P)-dependent oxidoreductase [Thiotrichales bacterium]